MRFGEDYNPHAAVCMFGVFAELLTCQIWQVLCLAFSPSYHVSDLARECSWRCLDLHALILPSILLLLLLLQS